MGMSIYAHCSANVCLFERSVVQLRCFETTVFRYESFRVLIFEGHACKRSSRGAFESVSEREGVFIYVVLDKSRANLAMARRKVQDVDKELTF